MTTKVIATLSFTDPFIYDTYRNELYDTRKLTQQQQQQPLPQQKQEYSNELNVNARTVYIDKKSDTPENTASSPHLDIDEQELNALEMMDFNSAPLWFMSGGAAVDDDEAGEGEELMSVTSKILPETTHDIDTIVESVIKATREDERLATDSVKEKMQETIEQHEAKKQHRQQALLKQDLFAKECELLTTVARLTEEKSLFDYTAQEIIETGLAKTDFLSTEYDLREAQLSEMMRLMKNNTLMELAYRDKRSKKILELADRLEETYLKEYEERGDAGVAQLNDIVGTSYRMTQDPENDETMIKNSQPKKRGRTREEERRKKPNAIELHRKEWATCKRTHAAINGDDDEGDRTKTAAATKKKKKKTKMGIFSSKLEKEEEEADEEEADEEEAEEEEDDSTGKNQLEQSDRYKTFIMVLKLLHDNIQSTENHGFYLVGMHQLMNKMRERPDYAWPMRELCEAILHMQMCLGIETIENIQLTPDEEYYCSYSGQRIHTGDTVKHIRILVKDHYRHNRWEILKSIPDRRFESPEFMDSVRAFFIKTPVVSLPGLFYRDFSDSYKANYPEYFKPGIATTTTTASAPKQDNEETGRAWINTKNKTTTTTTTTEEDVVKPVNSLWHQLDTLRKKRRKKTSFSRERRHVSELLDVTDDQRPFTSVLADIILMYWQCDDADDDDAKLAFTNEYIFLLTNMVTTLFDYHVYDLHATEVSHKEMKRLVRASTTIPEAYKKTFMNNEVLRRLLTLSLLLAQMTTPEEADQARYNPFLSHCDDIAQCGEFTAQQQFFLVFFDYLFPQCL